MKTNLSLNVLLSLISAQEIAQINRRAGLPSARDPDTDPKAPPSGKWFQNDPVAQAEIRECRRAWKEEAAENGWGALPNDQARDIVNCLAKHVARDNHHIFEDPRGQLCYNKKDYGKYDTHYSPNLMQCLEKASRFRNVCEPELSTVPWVRDFIAKVPGQYEEFYWCFYNGTKSIYNNQIEEYPVGESAWGMSRKFIGKCLKHSGQRAYLGDLTTRDFKALSMLFKRNCRLSDLLDSISGSNGNPCYPNQIWKDDGSCKSFQCTCPGQGRAPDEDIDVDEDLALCYADGVLACAECDSDDIVGQYCDQERRTCRANEFLNEYGACQEYNCYCSGNGRPPSFDAGDSEEVLATCSADNVNTCAQCFDLWTGEFCETPEINEETGPPGQNNGNPGQSGGAPGQNNGSPGQSGGAPGQTGSSPGLSGGSPGGGTQGAPGQNTGNPGQGPGGQGPPGQG